MRTGEVPPSTSITQHTDNVFGTLAIAVLFLLAQRYLFPQRPAQACAAPVGDVAPWRAKV